jgi:hypothetical protein
MAIRMIMPWEAFIFNLLEKAQDAPTSSLRTVALDSGLRVLHFQEEEITFNYDESETFRLSEAEKKTLLRRYSRQTTSTKILGSEKVSEL